MTFPCQISQGGEIQTEALCLADTGAGAGYLMVPIGKQLSMDTYPVNSPTVLADGRAVNIVKAADVSLTVLGVTKKATLRILPTREDQMSVLFGRDLISLFGLVIYRSDKILMPVGRRKAVVYERSRDKLCFLNGGTELDSPDTLPDGVVALDPSVVPLPDPSESVLWALPDSVVQRQVDLLDGVCASDPQPLPYCLGVRMGLRRLGPQEPRDTCNQTFCFEIEFPRVSPPPKGTCRLYAATAFARLSEANKLEFDRLVNEYVEAGWWQPISRQEAEGQYGNPANIFGIEQHGKLRLVADFRQLNLHFKSSTELPRISSSLLSIMLSGEQGIMIGDCRSAFLRVRLRRGLWVHTGNRDFLTHRMSFGLSFGPEGLRCSAGRLWTLSRQSCEASGLGSIFVDDWFLLMRQADIQGEGAKLLNLLSLAGFDCIRKKFQFHDPGKPVSLFNCGIQLSASETTIECKRGDRMQSCRRLLEANRLSKRQYFELAGCMSYDPVKGHPEARLVCDLLRSVIGSSCSQQPWHTAIDISQLEPVDQDLTESIMAWLRELVEEECAHTVEIDRSARDIHLKLQVDASFFGHGSCILFRTGTDHEWRVVQADASAWKKKEIAYSINRLEALALLIALQKLASFLQQFHSSTFGQQRTFRITVECDNATAIAWATKGPSSLVEKSVERRAIMRLCDALNEELQEIGKLSTLELKHLEGTQNSTADKLSRLMERQAISKQGIPITIGKLFRQRYEKLKINAVKEEPESLVAGRSLVEEIAGSAWSLSDSIATFSRLRALLRRWGSRGGDGAQTEQDERAFYMEVQSLLSNPRMYSMIDGVAHLVHNATTGRKCRVSLSRKQRGRCNS